MPAPDAFYETHRRGLLVMLRRLVRDGATAEDLCQDACRIFDERMRSGGLEDPDKAAAYLHQTARNLAIAELRKRARRRTDNDSEAVDAAVDETLEPYSAAEREQHAVAVRRLLKQMPQARDRQLLIRLFVDEADKDEICAELGLSGEHFNRVLYRAKQRFRALVEQAGIGLLLAAALAIAIGAARPVLLDG